MERNDIKDRMKEKWTSTAIEGVTHAQRHTEIHMPMYSCAYS